MTKRFKSGLIFWLFLLGALGALEVVHPSAAWARLLFPRPLAVLKTIVNILSLSKDSALKDIALTSLRILGGLIAGTVLAVPCGLSAGLLGRAFGGVRASVDFLRGIPQIALFPVFALLFGIDSFGKGMMAAVATFLIVFVAAADGAMYGSQERQEVLTWMGATSWQKFVHLTLPQSLPSVGVGIRIAASVAVIVVLVAEMLYGTLDGIGYRLYLAQLGYHVDEMWAFIVLIGLLGMGLNAALSSLQRRLVPWDRLLNNN